MPPAVAVRAESSRAEQQLIAFCEGMRQESRVAKEATDLKDAETNLNFVRGEQTARLPRSFPAFMFNLLWDFVQRKVGLYTDARPILEVVSGNNAMKDRTELLTQCEQALWDETTWGERLARGVAFGLQVGCNVGMMAWDPLVDQGRGDIRARFFDPRAVWLDPSVTAATDMEQAEFVCTEEVRAIAALIEQFGPRAEAVRPDGDLSSYPERGPSERGLISPAAQWNFRQRKRGQRSVSGQVPRAYTRHYWFKDWERDPATGKPSRYERVGTREDGSAVLRSKRRKIRHVVVAGGTVLVDEPNPYWHGMYPIDILDWGMESDHAWGQSEIKQLRSAQSALNQLASQILRNTNLTNNFKVIADSNALDPDQWADLTNRPAIILRKRPNTALGFESPPALPAYVFTVMEFLMGAIDKVGGLNEAARGSGSPSQSGVAVECADAITQCLTMRGWKYYHELDEDTDWIYTLNTETQAGEWSPLLQVNIQKDYQGPMVRMQSKGIDALVTPNHGWYVDTYRKKNVYQRLLSHELNVGHRIPCQAALPEDHTSSIYTNAYVELAGWIVTEGAYRTHITIKPNGKRYTYPQVSIAQSLDANPANCERITACLETLGIPYGTKVDRRSNTQHWTLGLAISRRLIAEFPDKRPGYAFLYSLTTKQLRLLAETMLFGDGRWFGLERPDTRISSSYFSCDKELADQFQMIATLAGIATSQTDEGPNEGGYFSGVHREEKYGNSNRVVCRSKTHASLRTILDEGKRTTEYYEGAVWCPTTTTGTWLARRDGITYFTSNSLQIAAQTTIRLQARRIESFLQRLFQKSISMFYQYYTGDRALRIYGPGQALQVFQFDRARLTMGLDRASIQEAFRDFYLHIQPGSSLNATRIQRAVMAGNLYQLQLLPGIDVLKASEWPNPEQTLQEARADLLERTQVMTAAAAMGSMGAGGNGSLNSAARGGAAARQPASFPANAG
jgi:hypothetical protein